MATIMAALFLQNILRRDMFQAETDALDDDAALQMQHFKTAFAGRKDFNRSSNWHKSAHCGVLYRWLGRFRGALSDEHPEVRYLIVADSKHTNN